MYYKQLYVFHEDTPIPAVIRNYCEEDFTSLIALQEKCFPAPFPKELWWNREQLLNHISLFPEGALCLEIDGQIAGSMTTLLVDLAEHHLQHTWSNLTDHGYIRTHNPLGESLYVVDISVDPNFRGAGIGKCLMHAMYQVVVHLGLERLVGGSRIPGYHKMADSMTAKQYVEAVVKGDLNDPVLSFLLRCGRTPVEIIPDYLVDEESGHYGVLMEWKNPFILAQKE